MRGDKTLAVVGIPLHGTGESDEALESLAAPREDVVPATIGDVPGTTVNVGGMTAGGKDFNDTTKAHLPLVFGFVLGAAFLLLLVAFRSIVIPLEAIVLNLLSRIGGGAVSAARLTTAAIAVPAAGGGYRRGQVRCRSCGCAAPRLRV